MRFEPKVYSTCDFKLPKMNWQTSISVDVFDFSDTMPYKVFWQMEPPVVEGHADVIPKLIKNHEFYDLILTWDASVLSQCKNAVLFPPGAVWYQSADTSEKKFAASFLTSSKRGGYEYDLRHLIYNNLSKVGDMDVSKHMSPPYLPNKKEMLVPFQYSVVVENFRNPNYFTEKINDCFATKTIPVYYGAPNIGKFYNVDGIVPFGDLRGALETLSNLNEVLQGLTPGYYASKRAAIEENYEKALKYHDRTGNVVRAIEASWTSNVVPVHSGDPNVDPHAGK